MAKDQEVIDKYKVETAAIRQENEKLKKEAVTFQVCFCSIVL